MADDAQRSAAPRRPSRRAVVLLGAGAVAAVSLLYLLVAQLAGLDETWGRLNDGEPAWIALAAALELASFAGYAALFRLVAGLGWRATWGITLAGVAATRLVAAAGAGGIALTAWALRREGMRPRAVLARLSTFFVVLYGVFMAAMVIAGLGLRADWFEDLRRSPSPSCLRSSVRARSSPRFS